MSPPLVRRLMSSPLIRRLATDHTFMSVLRHLICWTFFLVVILVTGDLWPFYIGLASVSMCLLYLGNSIHRAYSRETRDDKWAELPPDIMDNILNCLTLTQAIKLRTVCKPWYSTVRKLLLPPPSASRVIYPWLFIAGFPRDGESEFLFYSISESRHIRIRVHNTDLRRYNNILTANDGWLVISGSHNNEVLHLFLLNPITHTRIQPPPWNSSYNMHKIIVGPSLSFLSALGDRCGGIHAATANKLIVATISDDTLVFSRSGDSTWTTLKNPNGNQYADITFCKGQLYALDERSLIWVYDFKVGWEDRASLELSMELSVLPPQAEPTGFEVLGPLYSHRRDGLYSWRPVSLMECCGDLLLIQTTVFTSTTAAFRVFKLDKSFIKKKKKLDKYLCQWVEVKNLQGDHALLLGRGFKHSLPVLSPGATASPSASNFLVRNCIYHICATGPSSTTISRVLLNGVLTGGFEISVFNLEDGSCKPCFPSSFHRFSHHCVRGSPQIYGYEHHVYDL